MGKKVAFACALAVVTAVAPSAHAVGCVDANSIAMTAISGTGAASAATSDESFTTGSATLFMALGVTLHGVIPETGVSQPGWPYTTSATIQNFPVPVPLKSGSYPNNEGIFLGLADGTLVGLNAQGTAYWTAFDTKRKAAGGATMCGSTPGDQIMATPTIQLLNFASQNFKNLIGDDLVMVPTYYDATCNSGYTANRVYAIKVSTGAVAWTFNLFGNQMDFVSDSCALDYATDTLYCGSNQPDGRAQPTLWAINTTNGSLRWAQNVGGIRSRPQLSDDGTKLYVATYAGTLTVRDTTANGAELWNVPITNTSNITRSPWHEFRNSGGHAGIIVVTDIAGNLHGFNEFPPDVNFPKGRGALAWPATNAGGLVMTSAEIIPFVGKAYVGVNIPATNSAQLHQIDLATGTDDAHATVGTGTPYEPSLDVSAKGNVGINRLNSANASVLKRYCVPWNTSWFGTTAPHGPDPVPLAMQQCTQDSDCNVNPPDPADPPLVGQCWQKKCDTTSGICIKQPYQDGTPCNDSLGACSCDTSLNGGGSTCPGTCTAQKCDVCHAGVCTSDITTGCPCAPTTGARGCAATSVCCPTTNPDGGTCIDITNDKKNCGGCTDPFAKGQPPDTDCTDPNFTRKCSQTAGKGLCKKDLTVFCGSSNGKDTSASQLTTAGLTAAGAISYEGFGSFGPAGPDTTGNTIASAMCNAYVSTTGYSGGDYEFQVDTNGNTTNYGFGPGAQTSIAQYKTSTHTYTFAVGTNHDVQNGTPSQTLYPWSGTPSCASGCNGHPGGEFVGSFISTTSTNVQFYSMAPAGSRVTDVAITVKGDKKSGSGALTVYLDNINLGTVSPSVGSGTCSCNNWGTVHETQTDTGIWGYQTTSASGPTLHHVTITIPGGDDIYLEQLDITETYELSTNVSSLYTGGGCTICTPSQSVYSGGGNDYVQTFYDDVPPYTPVTGMTISSYGAICTGGVADTFQTLLDGVAFGSSSVNGGATCSCGLACGQYGFAVNGLNYPNWGGYCGFKNLTGLLNCSDDNDCSGGLVCLNNRCQCRSSADCASGETCTGGTCSCAQSTNNCAGKGPYLGTLANHNYICKTSNHTCVECNTNSDCATNMCDANGHCTCSTGADCLNAGGGRCMPGNPVGTPNYCGCIQDTDCPNNGKCWGLGVNNNLNVGRCVGPNDPCADDADCNIAKYNVGGNRAQYCQHQAHTVETKVSGTGNIYFYNTKVKPHFDQPGLVYHDSACAPAPTLVLQGAPTTGGTFKTMGLGPNTDVRYNSGPVGPVVAPMSLPGDEVWAGNNSTTYGKHGLCNTADVCMWVGNWAEGGDVWLLTGHNCQSGCGSCNWTAERMQYDLRSRDFGAGRDRISAMTWSRLHHYYYTNSNVDALVLFYTHTFDPTQGSEIWPMVYQTEGGGFTQGGGTSYYGNQLWDNHPQDHNIGWGIDAKTGNPVPAGIIVPGFIPSHGGLAPLAFCGNTDLTCEDFLSAVRSASSDPFFGDIYIDGLDRSGHDEILVIRADDFSIHNLYDSTIEQRLCTSAGGDQACPAGAFGWVNGEGRVNASSGVGVHRLVPTWGGTPTFTDYPTLQ